MSVLLWLLIFLKVSMCFGLSGLYYDNGIDQTVIHKYLNNREKKEMQNEILHVLGLHHRPRPVLKLPNLKHPESSMSSAPRFLKDVYQSLTEEDTGDLKLTSNVLDNEFNVSYSDVNSMNQADVIISFMNHGHHLHAVRHHHGDGRFWFDLSEVPELMAVISAELRVFVNFNQTENATSSSIHEDDSHPNAMPIESVLIIAYKIGSGDQLVYADSKEVMSHQQGWIAFNISLVLMDWLSNPENNYGMQLVFISDTGKKISSREAGVIGSYGDVKLQPFMVAFFRAQLPPLNQRLASSLDSSSSKPSKTSDDDSVRQLVRKRIRRQASNSRKKGKGAEDSSSWNPYADLDARLSRRSCQKKNLYVSFRDLGWQDWIIAPDGYAAFYCNGECSFPLNAHMNASNHAIVQTLVHLMNPYRVPKPCCAPIKLSSISVLYFDDNSNVILKKYRNMVVKSCGCH